MDWHTAFLWINRVGIIFEFLSFWLAAPEIISEIRNDEGLWITQIKDKLVAWLQKVSKYFEYGAAVCVAIGTLPITLVLILVTQTTYKTLKKMGKSSEADKFAEKVFFAKNLGGWLLTATLLLIVASFVSSFVLVSLKISWAWLPGITGLIAVALILMAFMFILTQSGIINIAKKLMMSVFRKRILILGIFLYVIGSVFQFIATFY